ncbi:hypothetical protein [Paludifilum halophilum]|uniref:Uncharacterized protein n=1 Tax=Paludifilum halophilum TaxID=1642702 RepID=A0A235BC74_9BACL|nr:hypothetical protein [Paludifilum halophilum]OYD09884.1 hypothetical protein CHM34_02595 [Paludifilum halophilum]
MNKLTLFLRRGGLCFLVALCGWTLSGLPVQAEPSGDFILKGTMRYLDIQGGCWVLVDESGERFELVGDAEQLARVQVDGLKVRVVVRRASDRVSRCMIGPILYLQRIIETEQARSVEPGSRPTSDSTTSVMVPFSFSANKTNFYQTFSQVIPACFSV